MFSNPVTFLSGLGTAVVTFGVLSYTKAKQIDAIRLAVKYAQDSEINVNGKDHLKVKSTLGKSWWGQEAEVEAWVIGLYEVRFLC